MMRFIIQICKQYRDVISYAIFGVLTTIVNIITYYVSAHFFGLSVMQSTIIAWVLAVLFAYITNRKWVFHSNARSVCEIAKELTAFFTCRLTTGFIDIGCMFVFVDILNINDIIVKAAANILVIILNYIASKIIIFK